jgi:acetyl-CoA synthetase
VSAHKYVWEPSEAVASVTNMAAFMRCHGIRDLAALLSRADDEPSWYWKALLDFFDIRFVTPYREVLDTVRGIAWPDWCVGGTTNVTLNCIDRHRNSPVWTKPAIISEREDGSVVTWTYAGLDAEINRIANSLRARGVKPGDVVCLLMPMVPEAAAGFFAVAKIGAVVMPLFSGFGPDPIATRLLDANATAVIAADITWRRGKAVPMLRTLEQALEAVPSVHTVLVHRRSEVNFANAERMVEWPDRSAPAESPTEIVPAEAPVMLMYTSGTTGRPKGTIHTHCGVLAKNALDMGLCIDLKADDRLLWMSDMGWIVGPKIVVSAGLFGSTLIMAEGTPDWPHPARMLKVASAHGATIVGVVPTIVRQMMRHGAAILDGIDLGALRATISIGEPWTPDAWVWFFENICDRRLPILNYAGGTECGGAILISSFLQKLVPCAFGHAVPGCGADVVDVDGNPIPPGKTGELVMRRPSIGMTRGLWKAPERYIAEYWNVIPNVWVQGDFASRDDDGLWYLHGRSDDTIKISGKRTGPAEIETVLLGSGLLSDCAVVGLPDSVQGAKILAACVVSSATSHEAALSRQLADAIEAQLGRAYRPKEFVFVSELPKTRNSKTMRRVIRSALSDQLAGDLSTLANPAAVDELRGAKRIVPDQVLPNRAERSASQTLTS